MQRHILLSIFMMFFSGILPAADLPETVVQTGNDAMVGDISLSPDGKYLASCSSGRVSIWDVGTRKQMALPKFRGDANGVLFLPDSQTVAIFVKYAFTPLSYGTRTSPAVIFWDIAASRAMKIFPAETTQNPVSLAVHQDRNIMAVGHGDGALLLYDIKSGEKIRELAGHTKYIKSVCFSPDGRKLYSASTDKTIRCWEIATGAERYRSAQSKETDAMILSADGRMLYCSAVQPAVTVLDAASGREIRSLAVTGSVFDIALSADNRLLACGTYEGGLNLIDITSGKTIRSLKAHARSINRVAFSPDHSTVYTASDDQSIAAWNVASGNRIHSFGGSPVQIARSARYSPDGKRLILSNNEYGPRQWTLATTTLTDTPIGTRAKGSLALSRDGSLAAVVADGSIQLWDLPSGRMLKSISAHSSFWPVAMDISPDGKRAASGSFKELRLFDAANGTLKASFSTTGQVQAVRFSPDGKQFLTVCNLSNCIIRDSASGSIVLALGPENQYASNAVYAPDGKTILTKFASTLILWEAKTGKKIAETAINHLFQEDNDYLAFSPDGKTFLAGGETIGLFETTTLKQIRTFSGHRNYIYSAVFHPDGKQFVTTSRDGTTRCWDLDNGAWTAFVTGTDPTQWLIFNDEGYWDASARGGDFVAAVKGLNVWNIDQFALRTNRPDLILARFSDADAGYIRHLRDQYERRLRRLTMKESDLSTDYTAPDAAISTLSQKGNSVSIEAKFTAAKKALQRYHVYINDVPVFGSEGKSISGKKTSITEHLTLTAGVNKIEVSCTDAGGIESSRALRYLTAEAAPKPDCYFIGFGVSEYRDPAIRDLHYAAKDARDLEATFKAMAGRGFAQVHTHVLTDAAVTRNAIADAKDFLRNAKPDDTLVLFVSGHGVQAGTPLNYYYITADTRLDDVPGTAAEFDRIESILQGIPPRTKLFLIDTCESGESDDSTRRASSSSLAKGLSARTLDAAGLRALAVNRKTVPRRTVQSDRWIYNDLLRRSGAIVLSSCRADESSLESDQWQQGVFTRSVMNALRSRAADRDGNGIISTDELRTHVIKEVPELVKSLDPSAEQHPTVDRDNIYVKFGFPVIPAP